MKNLEKKFSDKLIDDKRFLTREEALEVAHELAEIASREIKYLDGKEVEKIYFENMTKPVMGIDDDGIYRTCFNELDFNNFIKAICSLALPTKERITKVLKKYGLEVIQTATKMIYTDDIASEILGDDK